MNYDFKLIKSKLLDYILKEIPVDKLLANDFIVLKEVPSTGMEIYTYISNILNAYRSDYNVYKQIEIFNKVYNKKTKLTGNWWEWRIGIPYMYLIYCLLSGDFINECDLTLLKFVRSFAKHGDLTYANQASICKNLFMLGVLTENEKYIDDALKYSIKVFKKVNPTIAEWTNSFLKFCIKHSWFPHPTWMFAGKEGLYDDGTFLQHTSIPYIGTYGKEIIQYAALLLACDIELPEDIIEVLPDWIKAYELALYDGQLMLTYCGRSANNINSIEAGLLLLKYVSEVKSKLNIKTETESNFFCFLNNAARVIYQQPKFRFCILMFSDSVALYEAFAGNNYQGSNLSLGQTYLYLPGDINYSLGYYTRVGYDKIPGTYIETPSGKESKHPLFTYNNKDLEYTQVDHFKVFSDHVICFKYYSENLGIVNKTWYLYPDHITCKGTSDKEGVCVVDNRYNAKLKRISNTIIEDTVNHILYIGHLTFEGTMICTVPGAKYEYVINVL